MRERTSFMNALSKTLHTTQYMPRTISPNKPVGPIAYSTTHLLIYFAYTVRIPDSNPVDIIVRLDFMYSCILQL